MGAVVPVFAHVEVAVGKPKTILDLDVHIPLALQKRNRPDPVALLDIVLQRWHLLLLDLVVLSILGVRALNLGLGNRCPRSIHPI